MEKYNTRVRQAMSDEYVKCSKKNVSYQESMKRQRKD